MDIENNVNPSIMPTETEPGVVSDKKRNQPNAETTMEDAQGRDHCQRSPRSRMEHLGASRQYWRDMILGVNDGLVSTFLLVAGVGGGGMSSGDILLTGIAGALAGAVSMSKLQSWTVVLSSCLRLTDESNSLIPPCQLDPHRRRWRICRHQVAKSSDTR